MLPKGYGVGDNTGAAVEINIIWKGCSWSVVELDAPV